MTKMKRSTKFFIGSAVMAGAFVLMIFLLLFVDRKAVGFEGTMLGLSWINKSIFDAVGTSGVAKIISEIIGYFSILVALFFVGVFVYQWIKNKSLKKVDRSLLNLMLFYVVIGILYVLFLFVKINYRPEEMEPSFPSSHTLLIISILGSAIFYLHFVIKNKNLLNICLICLLALILFGVTCRFLSGVHWFTDILGGIFLSGALFFLLIGLNNLFGEKQQEEQKNSSDHKVSNSK